MKQGLGGLTRFALSVWLTSFACCIGQPSGVELVEADDSEDCDVLDRDSCSPVDVATGGLDCSMSDQSDINCADLDASADVTDAVELVLPEKLRQWEAFGNSHVMLSIDSSVLLANVTGVYWDEWVSRYEVTLLRAGGAEETILSGNVGNASWTVWPQRLTEVVAFPAAPGEVVSLCLLLYGPDDSLFESGCQQRTLVPGTYGQVLWQLSQAPCYTDPYMKCLEPQIGALATGRTRESDTPTLYFAFTLGEQAGVPSPGTSVSLAFAPPLTCEAALAWFEATVLDHPSISFHSCYEPVDGMDQRTGAEVELPSAAAAMGLFHEILSLPEGVPVAFVWEAVDARIVEADDFMVGVSYGQLGTAQAQYACETWFCE